MRLAGQGSRLLRRDGIGPNSIRRIFDRDLLSEPANGIFGRSIRAHRAGCIGLVDATDEMSKMDPRLFCLRTWQVL